VAEWILQIFAHASGLVINMEKTEFFPIRCEGSGLTFLENNVQKRSSFSCTYLGLPLHVKKLPRSLFHQIIQKIGDKLPGWKRIFFLLSKHGNSSQISVVLSTHILPLCLHNAKMGI
jgi:hypothetical protein